MTAPQPIRTFAFLDLETTGLPSMNFGKTSITEFCMIACSSSDLKGLEDDVNSPRSANKLTLCFNPGARIDPEASRLSGLDNYMLEDQSKFDGNAANTIKGFIARLPKPVCLVAHNGNRFDFPILRKQLLKAGVDLPDDVLCIDSLEVFRKLDNIINSSIKAGLENLETAATKQDCEILLVENDKDFLKLLEVEVASVTKSEEKTVDWQKINETTPRRPVQQKENHRKALDDKSPASGDRDRVCKSRRELFPSPDSASKRTPTKRYPSYKLGDIYERRFSKKAKNDHQAEVDTLTLLKIASSYREHFEKYAVENATKFSAVSTAGLR